MPSSRHGVGHSICTQEILKVMNVVIVVIAVAVAVAGIVVVIVLILW